MIIRALAFFGTFELIRDGASVTRFHSDKVRALLAYLATESNRSHARASLTALLWPEQADQAALRNLSQTLVRLRDVLGHADPAPLGITWQAIQWLPQAATVDVVEFTRLARSSNPIELEQAAVLYRGEFLAGFSLPGCEAFEEWLLLMREQFQQQALQALSTLAEHYLNKQQWGAAAASARRQIEFDRWREDAYRQLMCALLGAGDRPAALAVHARCEQVLRDDLGIAPDAATQALAEHIYSANLRAHVLNAQPSATTLQTAPMLPVALTALLGRETEFEQISTLLQIDGVRLVTIVGAGGVGKTRLALALATALHNSFAHSVSWVSLAGITAAEPALQQDALAATVGAALGFSFSSRVAPLQELREYLSERTMLLVLDNCEHLATAAPFARELLEAAPRLRILATSRVVLDVAGEQPLRLEALPVPELGDTDLASSPVVQLFLERARRHAGGFSEQGSLAAVVHLCRLLDGLPLGIELAARWVGHYTCEEIAAEIEADLDFLTVQSLDIPQRQRSLRAAFDYSWRLLDPAKRQALTRLSVFCGVFDRAAAQNVAAARTTTLAALVDASLVRHVGVGRYSFHELVRQFAFERLAEVDETECMAERHAVYHLNLLAQQAALLNGSNPQTGMQVIHNAVDNIRQAWDWAVGRGAWELLAASLPALRQYVRIDGLFYEYASRIAATAQRLEGYIAGAETAMPLVSLLGRLRSTEACLLQNQEARTAAAAAARQAIALGVTAGDAAGEAYGYLQLSGAVVPYIAALAPHEARESMTWLERAIMLCRSVDSTASREPQFVAEVKADCLLRLSAIRIELREYTVACTLAEQALTLAQIHGYRMQEIRALNFYAAALENAGCYEAAYLQRKAMLELARTNSARSQEYVALNNLSCTLIYLGDYANAYAYAQAAVGLLGERVRSPYDSANFYHTLSWATCRAGEVASALEAARQALAFAQKVGTPQNQMLPLLALGDALFDMERYDESHATYTRALRLGDEYQMLPLVTVALAGIARCQLQRGAVVEAKVAVDEIIRDQDILALGSLWEPLRVAETCYRVLHASLDPRAYEVLHRAVKLIDQQAATITDHERRRMFREQIVAHRVLLEASRLAG